MGQNISIEKRDLNDSTVETLFKDGEED